VHPGVVGGSPKWIDQTTAHPAVARTPTGRLATMDEVADAIEFLLRNGGVNGQDLFIDGGFVIG
jgi:NAD(P)-dependent dehydrogenase (short-subunit alcohol dehydrogenase family)